MKLQLQSRLTAPYRLSTTSIRRSVPIRLHGFNAFLALGTALLSGVGSQALAAPITHYLTINPIQICDDDGLSCAPTPFYPDDTYKIFSQAGIAPVFLPITQLNNSSLLAVDGVASVDQPGNGKHPNTTTVNAWFANTLNTSPGFVLYGQAWNNANGLVINGSAVQGYSSTGRRDTFAHELGHNLGLGHSDFGAGAGNNLMTTGSSRLIPSGVGDITPDGANLSQLTAAQKTKILSSPLLAPVPSVLVDTRGSTPFSTDNFFSIDFVTGSSSVYMKSLLVDLSPAGAFFDSTNTSPGNSSSPFAISTASLVGITASDITLEGGNSALNGSQTLRLLFADNAFKSGDRFSFGVDIDLFSQIDDFGATPQELVSSLFTFEFSDGYSVRSALADDLTASSTLPSDLPIFFGTPSGGPLLPPGTITDDPDPEPVPGPLPLFGAFSAYSFSRALRKRISKAQDL